MGRIGCVRREKNPTRLRGMNFCTSSACFAPSVGRQPNGLKSRLYETHRNVNLGSNGVDRVRSLPIIPTRLRGTNFCTSSARFAPSVGSQTISPECTQLVRNALKRQFRVQWGGSGAFVVKNSDATLWHELLHLFGPFCTEFRKATKRSRIHPNSMKNAPKC